MNGAPVCLCFLVVYYPCTPCRGQPSYYPCTALLNGALGIDQPQFYSFLNQAGCIFYF